SADDHGAGQGPDVPGDASFLAAALPEGTTGQRLEILGAPLGVADALARRGVPQGERDAPTREVLQLEHFLGARPEGESEYSLLRRRRARESRGELSAQRRAAGDVQGQANAAGGLEQDALRQ